MTVCDNFNQDSPGKVTFTFATLNVSHGTEKIGNVNCYAKMKGVDIHIEPVLMLSLNVTLRRTF